MVLTVSFADFPAAAKKASQKDVFVSEHGKGTLLTAADLQKNFVLASLTDLPGSQVEMELKEQGFNLLRGRWSDGVALPESGNHSAEAFVAAVAYQSKEPMPGLWMDAFPTPPTPQIVLRAVYDEFRANDEIGDVTYEEFLRMARPNVVILSPGEVATFLAQKEEC